MLVRESPAAKGLKAAMKQATRENIDRIMKTIAGDPVRLAEVVAGGHIHWRIHFLRGMHGLPVDDDVADMIFGFFCQHLLAQFPGATPETDAKSIATQYLDQVEVASPPTQAEIDASWEVEVQSSEAAKRQFYRDGINPDLPLASRKPIIVSSDPFGRTTH